MAGRQRSTSGKRASPNRQRPGAISANGDARWVTRSLNDWREWTLSPDAKRIAYVQSNDLYVQEIETGEQFRVTADGSETRLNGLMDWVYQEELYGRGNYRAIWWSPDSSAIAFLRFDIAPEPVVTLGDSRAKQAIGCISVILMQATPCQ